MYHIVDQYIIRYVNRAIKLFLSYEEKHILRLVMLSEERKSDSKIVSKIDSFSKLIRFPIQLHYRGMKWSTPITYVSNEVERMQRSTQTDENQYRKNYVHCGREKNSKIQKRNLVVYIHIILILNSSFFNNTPHEMAF